MARLDRWAGLALALFLAGCGDVEFPSSSAGVSGGRPIPRESLAQRDFTQGQRVYVPIYSEFGFGSGKPPYPFAVNLSIRNTDAKGSVIVTSARYYDNDGKLLREYLEEPRELAPMGTATVVIAQKDMTGGLGANVIVEWGATEPVSMPVIEAVMLSRHGSKKAAAFRSPGRVIEERGP